MSAEFKLIGKVKTDNRPSLNNRAVLNNWMFSISFFPPVVEA